MNLFAIGLGVPADVGGSVSSILTQVATENFPELDMATAWRVSGPGFFAGSVHHGASAAPRRYVHTDGDGVVTFFSGLPVSPRTSVLAHNAKSLSQHWGSLPDLLDGQYAVAQVRPRQRSVELWTDPLGLEQVYVLATSTWRVVSNSVAVLQRLAPTRSVDLTAAAMMASTGWVSRDRTMLQGVCVVPHGQHLQFQDGAVREGRRSFTRELLASKSLQEPVTPVQLADALTAQVAELGKISAIACPLTAGRDSRVLAALCLRAGVEARYYTFGRPADKDVVTAAELAAAFRLPHEFIPSERDWEDAVPAAASLVIRQTDGVVSLRQMFTPQLPALGVDVGLWGAGGEIARTTWTTPQLVLGPSPTGRAAQVLVRRVMRAHSGLVTDEGQSRVRRQLLEFVRGATDAGVHGFDMTELYYAEERVPRWAYSNQRVSAPHRDTFSPFCTQPFLRATHSMDRRLRYAEHLHFRLMEELRPELLAVPYEKPWRSQRLGVAAATDLQRQGRRTIRRATARLGRRSGAGRQAAWRSHVRSGWFEVGLDHFRALCLDQHDSPLWQFIDRSRFEGLMDPSRPAEHRLLHVDRLLNVITPFAYEAALKEAPRQPPESSRTCP